MGDAVVRSEKVLGVSAVILQGGGKGGREATSGRSSIIGAGGACSSGKDQWWRWADGRKKLGKSL